MCVKAINKWQDGLCDRAKVGIKALKEMAKKSSLAELTQDERLMVGDWLAANWGNVGRIHYIKSD